jgi:hypothetical protein
MLLGTTHFRVFEKIEQKERKKHGKMEKIITHVDDKDLSAFKSIKCNGCYVKEGEKANFTCHSNLRSFSYLIDMLYIFFKNNIVDYNDKVFVIYSASTTSLSMKYLINYFYDHVEMVFVGGDYHIGSVYPTLDDVMLVTSIEDLVVVYDEGTRFSREFEYYILTTKEPCDDVLVIQRSFNTSSYIETNMFPGFSCYKPDKKYGSTKKVCGSIKRASTVYKIIEGLEMRSCNSVLVNVEILQLRSEIEKLKGMNDYLLSRVPIRMVRSEGKTYLTYLHESFITGAIYYIPEAYSHAVHEKILEKIYEYFALENYVIYNLTPSCGGESYVFNRLGSEVQNYGTNPLYYDVAKMNGIFVDDFESFPTGYLFDNSLIYIDLSLYDYDISGSDKIGSILSKYKQFYILIKTYNSEIINDFDDHFVCSVDLSFHFRRPSVDLDVADSEFSGEDLKKEVIEDDDKSFSLGDLGDDNTLSSVE